MKKSLLILVLTLCSVTTCYAYQKFAIKNEGFDKYSELNMTKTENNWVKSKQGKYIAFNFVIASKDGESEKDHYLVLKNEERSIFTMTTFSIGNHLILTINGNEKIHLKPSSLSAIGKFSSLSNGNFDHTVYLEPNVYNKIVHANSIYFELQGNRFSQMKEVTGWFSQKNIQDLRSLINYSS